MKYKIWVTAFVFISVTMIYSMEKELPKKRPQSSEITASNLPKKYKYDLESSREDMDIDTLPQEQVGSELLEEEEYNQRVNEALSTFAYNKEKKEKRDERKLMKLLKW